jgi:hypothetical protein
LSGILAPERGSPGRIGVSERQQLLLRNLGFGAVLGAGVGILQVVSTQAAPNIGALLGGALGGMAGGAILVVLVAAIFRWLFK